MVDTTTSSSSNNTSIWNPSSSTSNAAHQQPTTVIENVAELQFGPDFDDIHSTCVLCGERDRYVLLLLLFDLD
jgi:hypothetical protein